jgi:hypothetical protein
MQQDVGKMQIQMSNGFPVLDGLRIGSAFAQDETRGSERLQYIPNVGLRKERILVMSSVFSFPQFAS